MNSLQENIEIVDASGYVRPQTTRSRPRMTKFERTMILSMRSEQIANGTAPFVDKIDGDRPIDTAEREFAAGRIPFIIRRFIPTADGGVVAEDWLLEDLEPCDRRLAHQPPKNVQHYDAAETLASMDF